MDYNMFKECILEGMSEIFEGCEFRIHDVLKNNGVVLDGLVMSDDKRISPTVYLNDFYDNFICGTELNDIINDIERIFKDNMIDENYDACSLLDYKNSYGKVAFKLINYDMNERLLKTVPHRKFLDLAVVYYVIIKDDVMGNATVLINNNWLNEWKITEEELFKLASGNSPRILEPEIVSVKDMVLDLMEDKLDEEERPDWMEEECNMYVLTNKAKQYGAATILYDNILKDFARKNSSDIYILPSSVHELILVPASEILQKEGLTDMVKEVNSTQVPMQEILSDHAYIYNIEEDSITFC